MKVNISILCVMIGVCSGVSYGAGQVEFRCRGGESGTPWSATEVQQSKPKLLPTFDNGGTISVREFLVWDKSKRIVFRNSRKEIMSIPLSGNIIVGPAYLGKSDKPLSRLPDPRSRAVLVDKFMWLVKLFQSPGGSTEVFGAEQGEDLQHVHWNQEGIYSVVSNNRSNSFTFFQYKGDPSHPAEPFCSWEGKEGLHYSIADQNEFPYVMFHSVEPNRGREILVADKLNLKTCTVETQYRYPDLDPVWGVKAYYRFEKSDSAVIVLKDPERGFIWDRKDACHRLETNGSDVLPLKGTESALALWNGASLSVALLNRQTGEANLGRVFKDFKLRDVTKDDLWLTRDQSTLLFSPHFIDDEIRYLFSVKLSNEECSQVQP